MAFDLENNFFFILLQNIAYSVLNGASVNSSKNEAQGLNLKKDKGFKNYEKIIITHT